MNDELKHYGIKGMKWGIRRFQPYPKGKSGRFLGKDKKKKASTSGDYEEAIKRVQKEKVTKEQRSKNLEESKKKFKDKFDDGDPKSSVPRQRGH